MEETEAAASAAHIYLRAPNRKHAVEGETELVTKFKLPQSCFHL